MATPSPDARSRLSRRERQLMDTVYHLGEASVADIRAGLSDPPSYSAVRAHLRILEEKGHLRHRQDGPRYLYRPVVPRSEARESALRHLLRTFFAGSTQEAMVALLEIDESLDPGARARLEEMIGRAREEGR